MAMKCIVIIVPVSLRDKKLKQLHLNHMGIEKTRLLACESIHWVNMKSDIKETVKIAAHALISSQHNLMTKQCNMKYQENMGICRG